MRSGRVEMCEGRTKELAAELIEPVDRANVSIYVYDSQQLIKLPRLELQNKVLGEDG